MQASRGVFWARLLVVIATLSEERSEGGKGRNRSWGRDPWGRFRVRVITKVSWERELAVCTSIKCCLGEKEIDFQKKSIFVHLDSKRFPIVGGEGRRSFPQEFHCALSVETWYSKDRAWSRGRRRGRTIEKGHPLSAHRSFVRSPSGFKTRSYLAEMA